MPLTARIHAQARADLPADGDGGIAGPLVIDVDSLRRPAEVSHEIDDGLLRRGLFEHTDSKDVPGDWKLLRAIAQMPRDVIEQAGHLEALEPVRGRELELVVPLIRIEGAQLVAEDRFVVEERRRSPEDVVNHVDVAAKMGVPRKARVLVREGRSRQMEIVTGEEFRRGRDDGQGLLGKGRRHTKTDHRCDDEEIAIQECTV